MWLIALKIASSLGIALLLKTVALSICIFLIDGDVSRTLTLLTIGAIQIYCLAYFVLSKRLAIQEIVDHLLYILASGSLLLSSQFLYFHLEYEEDISTRQITYFLILLFSLTMMIYRAIE